MIEGLSQLKCGSCGNETVKAFVKDDDPTLLFLECTKCRSVTEVKPSPVKIVLDWPLRPEPTSDGILCRMD